MDVQCSEHVHADSFNSVDEIVELLQIRYFFRFLFETLIIKRLHTFSSPR